MRDWLEIDARNGIAFHRTDFAGNEPPSDVWHCDCKGKGRKTYSTQNRRAVANEKYKAPPPAEFPDAREPAEVDTTRPETLDEWQRRHSGKYCNPRRQFFIEITDNHDLDWREADPISGTPAGWAHSAFTENRLHYDEQAGTFSALDPASKKADAAPVAPDHG